MAAPLASDASTTSASAPISDRKPSASPPARDLWIDVFRGLTIPAVVLIHILPRFFRLHATGSARWWTLFTVHRLMFFAVPAFLLLSALVNTRSLIRRPNLWPYLKGRVGGIVWPYLFWSGVYIGYQKYYTLAGYHNERIPDALKWGIAWPHLYFLVVLAQILVALPFLVAILGLRRTKPPRPFWAFFLGGIILTALAYRANHEYLHLVRPGSSILWYLPAVSLGMYLGSEGGDVLTRLRRVTFPALIAAIPAGIMYRDIAARDALKLHVDTMQFQAAEWIYASAASLLLLGLSVFISEGWKSVPGKKPSPIAQTLAFIGRCSYPIYLAHPLVLILLDPYRLKWIHRYGEGSTFALLLAAAMAVPMLLAVVTDALWLAPLFFGRRSDALRSRPAERKTTSTRAADEA